jgi:hypothetical protein
MVYNLGKSFEEVRSAREEDLLTSYFFPIIKNPGYRSRTCLTRIMSSLPQPIGQPWSSNIYHIANLFFVNISGELVSQNEEEVFLKQR